MLQVDAEEFKSLIQQRIELVDMEERVLNDETMDININLRIQNISEEMVKLIDGKITRLHARLFPDKEDGLKDSGMSEG